jgi:hypothetical protein
MSISFRINNVLVILAKTNGIILSEHQFCTAEVKGYAVAQLFEALRYKP